MIPKAKRDRARQLRQDSTPLEQSFWRQVRGGRFSGFKFRRQQPIGQYVVDFVCQQARLVVELDGSQHAESHEYDRNRDVWLQEEGYRVFRVWNYEWNTQREAVLEKLWQMLHEVSEPSPPAPLPKWERGVKTSRNTTAFSRPGVRPAEFPPPLREKQPTSLPSPLREKQPPSLPSPLRGKRSTSLPSPLMEKRPTTSLPSPLRGEGQGEGEKMGVSFLSLSHRGRGPLQRGGGGVSELPPGWVECELDEIVLDVSYGYTAKSNPSGGSARMLRITDIQNNKVDWLKVPFCDITPPEREKYLLQKWDLVFARTGATVGKSFLIRDDVRDSVFASYLIRVRTFQSDIAKYLSQFFDSPIYWNQITEFSSGIGQPNVNGSKLKNLRVPLAPLPEQKRIADKLDAVLARVDACRKRLDRIPIILKRFRQSVLAAATSGKLTEEWRRERPERGLGLTGYEIRRLAGLVAEPMRNGKSVRDGDETLVLRLSALKAGEIDISETKSGTWAQIDVSRFLIKPGDFLVARGNGSRDLVGRGGLVTATLTEIAFPDTMIRIRIDVTQVLPRFLRLIWDTAEVRKQIKLTARTTAGIWKIAQPDLERLELSVPPLDEQHEIVRRVETLFAYADRLEARYAAARAQVERLTPTLLAKAFRGELVPQDSNDEPAAVLLECIRAAREAAPVKSRR